MKQTYKYKNNGDFSHFFSFFNMKEKRNWWTHCAVLDNPAETFMLILTLGDLDTHTIQGCLTQDYLIGPSGCVRCHGNKVSTINAVIFSLSLLSAGLLFSQKGLSQGSKIWHGVLTHKKNKISGENKIGGTTLPPGGLIFLVFFEKTKSAQNCLKWREN